MYVYVFSSYYGGDKVAMRPDAAALGVEAGDLVKTDMSYVLCLGETCAFHEMVRHSFSAQGETKIVLKNLLSLRALKLMQQFVHHRYTTYHKALPLRIGPDDLIDGLLRYAPSESVLKKSSKTSKSTAEIEVQQLILVPDMRTLRAVIPQADQEEKGTIVLHSQSTDKQKKEAFRNLKLGKKHTLISTPSQFLQDRHALSQIRVVDHHKRRYKNQQDPRYDAVTVVQQLADARGASLELSGMSLEMPNIDEE